MMKLVGVLGGMGPMATVDFFEKVVKLTPVATDQEHIPMIIYNNPQIPSRIDAILENKTSPKDELVRSAKYLEDIGAKVIVIPCNTAHLWYEDIKNAVDIEVLHIVEVVADYIQSRQKSGNSEIMLFATAATAKMNLYQSIFKTRGVELKTPTVEEQQIIADAIDMVKAGKLEDNPHLPSLKKIMNDYYKQGIGSFVAGCTEVPILFRYIEGEFAKIDPTWTLAKKIVGMAGFKND